LGCYVAHHLRRQNGQVAARRSQMPLIPAWALTIHKCQGMTIDKAEMSLAECFEYGQLYVAVSRIRSLDGLSLRSFDKSKIRANQKVIRYYQIAKNGVSRKREKPEMITDNVPWTTKHSVEKTDFFQGTYDKDVPKHASRSISKSETNHVLTDSTRVNFDSENEIGYYHLHKRERYEDDEEAFLAIERGQNTSACTEISNRVQTSQLDPKKRLEMLRNKRRRRLSSSTKEYGATLSDEQKERIQKNKEKALALKRRKQKERANL